MALALWFRNCDAGEKALCGTYLLAASDEGSNETCWGVWVQNNGFFFDNINMDPQYFFLPYILEDRHTVTHKAWRHLAFVWDAADDSLTVYLDGEPVAKVPWGSKVSEMDCAMTSGASNTFVAIGHDLPVSEWHYGAGNDCWLNAYPAIRQVAPPIESKWSVQRLRSTTFACMWGSL
jgi:hypothetical protein